VRGAEVASGTTGAVSEGRASSALGAVSRIGPIGAAVGSCEGAPVLTTGADCVAVARQRLVEAIPKPVAAHQKQKRVTENKMKIHQC
jgi:hypothetical protein